MEHFILRSMTMEIHFATTIEWVVGWGSSSMYLSSKRYHTSHSNTNPRSPYQSENDLALSHTGKTPLPLIKTSDLIWRFIKFAFH